MDVVFTNRSFSMLSESLPDLGEQIVVDIAICLERAVSFGPALAVTIWVEGSEKCSKLIEFNTWNKVVDQQAALA